MAWKPWTGRKGESGLLNSTITGVAGDAASSENEAGPPENPETPQTLNHSADVTASATLEVHLQRAEQDSGYRTLQNESLPLTVKDKLHLHVTVSGLTYVYVFWIDTNGACNRMWPSSAESLTETNQQPVRELWLPPEKPAGTLKQKMFSLDDSMGLEAIIVATSPRPLGTNELRPIETARVDLAHFDAKKPELVSLRPQAWRDAQSKRTSLFLPSDKSNELVALSDDRERGVAGIVETIKGTNERFDDFSQQFNDVFASYTGLVFPHK